MKRKTIIKIQCRDHSKMDATIYCPTCRKLFELKDIIKKEQIKLLAEVREVLDKMKKEIENEVLE